MIKLYYEFNKALQKWEVLLVKDYDKANAINVGLAAVDSVPELLIRLTRGLEEIQK